LVDIVTVFVWKQKLLGYKQKQMNSLIFLLVLIVLVVIAYVVMTMGPKTGKFELKELNECTADLARIVGGSDKVVSMKVLHKITPYMKEVGTPEHVEEYLENYYDYKTRKIRILRDEAEDVRAPSKYKYIYTLISDIVRKRDIESAEEFIKNSKLTYKEFLSSKHRELLDYAPRSGNVSREQLKKISKLLDKYLIAAGTHIVKSKLLDKTDDLIHANKLFKFKSGKATLDPKRLKLLIDKDPSKVFELDYIGLIPDMYKTAVDSASSKASSYGRKTAEEELRRQIERDTETLRLFRDYPTTSRRKAEALEIALRLEKAAGRVYGDRYARKLLKDLYYDYYPSSSDLIYAPGLYGLGRRSAERETYEERNRRIRAETSRDESERGRKSALLAQEQSDHAMAQLIANDESAEREREAARSRESAEATAREDDMRKQLHSAEKAALDAAHARDLETKKLEGPVPDFAGQGLDPGLADLWAMGANERELAKDNIDLPLIHLN
jgi:hypothetical protein